MPAIMRYIEVLNSSSEPFRTLREVRFESRADGGLRKYASSRAVVLKGYYEGRYYAFKFFTDISDTVQKRYEILSGLDIDVVTPFRLLPSEIDIIDNGRLKSCPVLMSEWIEGESLHTTILKLCKASDSFYGFKELSRKLTSLFFELMSSGLYHGDIKPDNIICDTEGNLHLIDWDCCYHSELAAYPSYETGTYGFSHPLRSVSDYGRAVDDYPMAVILIMLELLAVKPYILDKDDKVFDIKAVAEGRDKTFNSMCETWKYLATHMSLLRFIAGRDLTLPNLQHLILRMGGMLPYSSATHQVEDEHGELRSVRELRSKLLGYVNIEAGLIVIDTVFGACTPFVGDIAAVRVSGRWFFINKYSKRVSSFYDYVRAQRDGSFYITPHRGSEKVLVRSLAEIMELDKQLDGN